MAKRLRGWQMGLFLAASIWICSALVATVSSKDVLAADSVTLKIYNPAGAREVTVLHAKRLDTLAGKTICELTNTGWQAHRTFPLVRELLKNQYPTVKIIPYDQFPQGIGIMDTKKAVEAVKAAKCDAVISGNAG